MVVDVQRGCAQVIEVDHDVVAFVVAVDDLGVITPASIGGGKSI